MADAATATSVLPALWRLPEEPERRREMSEKAMAVLAGMAGRTTYAELSADEQRALLSYSGFFGAWKDARADAIEAAGGAGAVKALEGLYQKRMLGWEIGQDIEAICGQAPSGSAVFLAGVTCPAHLAMLGEDVVASGALTVHTPDPITAKIIRAAMPSVRLVEGSLAEMPRRSFDAVFVATNLYSNHEQAFFLPAEARIDGAKNTQSAILACSRLTAPGGVFGLACFTGSLFFRERHQSEILARRLGRFAEPIGVWLPTKDTGFARIVMRKSVGPILDQAPMELASRSALVRSGAPGLMHEETTPLPDFHAKIAGADIFAGHTAPQSVVSAIRWNSYHTDGRGVWYNHHGTISRVATASEDESRALVDAVRVVDAARAFLDLRASGGGDVEAFEAARNGLLAAYTEFHGRHGRLRAHAVVERFMETADYPFLLSLEVSDDAGGWRPSAVFDLGMGGDTRDLAKGMSAQDALVECRRRTGRIDPAMLADLTGMSEDVVLARLDKEVLFLPQNGTWVFAPEHLSGDIVAKREDIMAGRAALERELENEPAESPRAAELAKQVAWARASEELATAAMPRQAESEDVVFRLGERWQPPEMVIAFARSVLGSRLASISCENGRWRLATGKGVGEDGVATPHYSGVGIMRTLLTYGRFTSQNGLDAIDDDEENPDMPGGDLAGENLARINLANARIDELHHRFNMWVRNDPTRLATMLELYNRAKNRFVLPQADRSVLSLDGLNPDFTPTDMQLDFAAICTRMPPQVIYAYPGSGKTFIMATAIRERMRTGLNPKALVVTLPNLVGEMVREFEKTYPGMGAEVRVVSYQRATRYPDQVVAEMLGAERGIWIMGYNAFTAMPLGGEVEGAAAMREIAAVEERMEIAQEDEMAGLVDERDKLLARHREAMEAARGRAPVSIVDALGGGMIVCDEADALRNLRGKGPGNLGLSGNALTEKARTVFDQMRDRYPNFALIMASGTLGEGRSFATIWPYLRYCIPQALEAAGELELNDWLRGNTVISESVVPTPDKGLVTKQVIMPNGSPVLTAMLESLIRYHPQTLDAVGLPKLNGGDIELRALPINGFQWGLLRAFAEKNDPYENLADFLPERPPAQEPVADPANPAAADEPTPDGSARLRLWGQMVRACVEPRFVGSVATQSNGKITRAVLDVVEDKIRNMGRPSVTLIFVDQVSSNSTGFGIADGDGWRREFAAAGILPERVAFAHEHTGRRRGLLLERVRRGEFDAVVSTRRGLGIGANLQDYVSQIIYLDVPLTTAPHNQSLCRGIRRGNHYGTVQVHFYVVSRSGELCLANHLKNKSEGQNALWRRSGFQVGDASAAVEALAGSMVSEIFGREDDRLARLETLKRIEIPRTEAMARLEASRRQRLALGITTLEREIEYSSEWVNQRRQAGQTPEHLVIGESVIMDGVELCARTALAERLRSGKWNGTDRPLKEVIIEHGLAVRAMEPELKQERLTLFRTAIRGQLVLDDYPGIKPQELRLIGMIGGSERQDIETLYEEGCAHLVEMTPLGIEAAFGRVAERADKLPLRGEEQEIARMGAIRIVASRPRLGSNFDVDLHFKLGDWSLFERVSCFGRSGGSLYHSVRNRLEDARKAFAEADTRLARMNTALAQARAELATPAGAHEEELQRLNRERDAIIEDLRAHPPERDDRDPSVPVEPNDEEAFSMLRAAWTRYRAAASAFAQEHGLEFDASPASVDAVVHSGIRDFSDQGVIDVGGEVLPARAAEQTPAPVRDGGVPLDTAESERVFEDIADLGEAFARQRECVLAPAPGNWIGEAHTIVAGLAAGCDLETGSGSPAMLRYLARRAKMPPTLYGYLASVADAAEYEAAVSLEAAPAIFDALGRRLAAEGRSPALAEPTRAASAAAAAGIRGLNKEMKGVRMLIARARQTYDDAVMGVANHAYNKELNDGHFQMLTALMERYPGIMDPVAGPLAQTALGLGGVPVLDVMDGERTRSDAENAFYRTMVLQVAGGPRGPRFLQGRFAHHNYATLANDVFGQRVRGRGHDDYSKLMLAILERNLETAFDNPQTDFKVLGTARDGKSYEACALGYTYEVWSKVVFHRRTESRHAARITTRQDLMMCLVDTPPEILMAAALVSGHLRRPRRMLAVVDALSATGADPNSLLEAARKHRNLGAVVKALEDPGLNAAAAQMDIASDVLYTVKRQNPALYAISSTYRTSLANRGYEQQIRLLGQMLARVAAGSYQEWRYSNEIATKQLAGLSPKAVEEWRANGVYRMPGGGWVVESDDPNMAMRAGSPAGAIPASCQRANGGAYNQCMLAYVLDANKKVFYAFSSDGTPVGRMIAKVAGSPPCLIDQGVYGPASADLLAALRTKAKAMDVAACAGRRTAGRGASRDLDIVNLSVNGFEYDDNLGVGERSGPARITVWPVTGPTVPFIRDKGDITEMPERIRNSVGALLEAIK